MKKILSLTCHAVASAKADLFSSKLVRYYCESGCTVIDMGTIE